MSNSFRMLRAHFAIEGLALVVGALCFVPAVTHALDPEDVVLLSDIEFGAVSSNVEWGVELPGCRLFVANRSAVGRELYCTNGRYVWFVKNINPGTASGLQYASMARLGNFAYFAATNGVSGLELWRTDGTPAGTTLVKDIRAGSAGADPRTFVSAGGYVYFSADDGTHGWELFRTDGTAAGTALVRDVSVGPNGSYAGYSQRWVAGNVLYFSADDGMHGTELWRTVPGPTPNAILVKDILPGFASGLPFGLALGISYGTKLVFRADDGVHGQEVFISDGTTLGTYMVKDENPGPSDSYPDQFAVFNGSVFYNAWSVTVGIELFRTNGTEAGTSLVVDLDPVHSGPTGLTVYEGALYFTAFRPDIGRALFRTDGTAAGTVHVNPSSSGPDQFDMGALTVAGGLLWFHNDRDATGAELWRSDGTDAGTRLVRDIRPGTASSAPEQLVAFGDRLLFLADDGVRGQEMFVWRTVPALSWVLSDELIDDIYTPARQFNTTGVPNTVARLAEGYYYVTFPNLGRAGGNVQVSAYGAGAATCQVAAWGAVDIDEVALVSCFLADGTQADARFTTSFFDAEQYPGKGAYLFAEQPTTPSYTPSVAHRFSSSGLVPTIARFGVGLYDVRLPGQTDVGGNIQVTAYGSAPRECGVMWTDVVSSERRITVACRTLDGMMSDAPFTLRYAFNDAPGPHGAYVFARQPSTPSYTPALEDRFSSTASLNTVTRSSVGTYAVFLSGMPGQGGVVGVTPFSWDANRCNVMAWTPSAGGQVVDVSCVNAAGAPADTAFYMSYLREYGPAL